MEGFLNYVHVVPSRKKHLTILKDVNGIIKPRRMTLLLGPPSSGKTTLLLALAGRLDPDLKVSVKVEFEIDILVELSRREKASNIKPDPDIDVFMKAIAAEGQETNVMTDYVLKILGLEVCADTVVGDAMLRGISGGQRKRVTTGEMLVGPAKVLFMDEISTGLDSSTTFQVVNSIKQYVKILNGTAVISLLQPAPETYDLFDDIILLSEGQIVYHGPREQVLYFFESMGFQCPERKGVADFLQEVTSKKDQMQYWVRKDEPYRFITSEEFAEAFQSFRVGMELGDELATPFDKSKSHPAALATRKYGVSRIELLKATMSREFLLMKRNSFVYIFKIIQQRDMLFYPSWAYALPAWILKIPISLVEVAIWVFITYYVIGFDPDVGRLFKQYILLVAVNQMAGGLFRFIGAAGRNMIIANTFGAFALLTLFALGGFVLSRDQIKKWWIWGYWISPLMYGQNAIVVNEFLGRSWRHVLPNSTEPLGIEVLKSRGFFTEAYWYWLGFGALLGFTLLLNLFFTLALAILNPFEKPRAVIQDEQQGFEQTEETSGAIQLSTYGNSSSYKAEAGAEQIRRSTSSKSSSMSEAAFEAIHTKKRGMVLPFEPHSITFDEITYSVDMPQVKKIFT
ncbi:hypothetical protein SLEP1_g43880 [Rubroshorea leprosula]|uniref:ABC transporter domain-containing protein n=1 Tax=Rubroshorea leprosula TaxID=152421 RepID=A0AAV5LEF6_9ROSI|nr:hypothetical protein SLEP1_g43880 [Rubroshorea leprosula]